MQQNSSNINGEDDSLLKCVETEKQENNNEVSQKLNMKENKSLKSTQVEKTGDILRNDFESNKCEDETDSNGNHQIEKAIVTNNAEVSKQGTGVGYESLMEEKENDEIKAIPRIKVANFAKINEADNVKDFRNNTDVTVDIIEDLSLTVKEELTDDDVLNQLDELENLVMRSPIYDSHDDLEPDNRCDVTTEDIKPRIPDAIEEINSPEEGNTPSTPLLEEGEIKQEDDSDEENMCKTERQESIYNERLKQKESMAKERFKNFTRMLEHSYPCYKKFLEKVEKESGQYLCKLGKSRHGPWNMRHTNRWKLKCIKKHVKEDYCRNVGPSMPNLRNYKIVWKIASSTTPEIDPEDDPTFPPFIIKIIKIFEDFFNQSELIQKEAAKWEFAKNTNKREFTAMTMRANTNNEVMVVVIGYNITPHMMDTLKKYFNTEVGHKCNVISLYCKSYIPKCTVKNFSTTTFLYGLQVITETVGNIRLQLTPRTNFWSNVSGMEALAQTINDFFTPILENTTLVDIGCGIGLISLMMANKYKQVIGLDASAEIDEAEGTRVFNKINNVVFIKESPESIDALFQDLRNHENVNAIINNNVGCGRSTEIMVNFRKLSMVKRLIFIATFTKHSQQSVLELMRPSGEIIGNPFVPVRACIVDTNPDNEHFEIVVLMQRRIMKKLKPDYTPTEWFETSPPKSNGKDNAKLINVEDTCNTQCPYESSEVRRNIPKHLGDKMPYEPSQRRKDFIVPSYSHQPDSPPLRERGLMTEHCKVSEPETSDDILENVKQQQKILEQATSKLSSSDMDADTAKQLKDMLSIVLEQTNKLQTKLPLITTAVTTEESKSKPKTISPRPLLSPPQSPPPKKNLPKLVPGVSRKYQNIAPLEPNLVVPVSGRRPKPPKTVADIEAKNAKRKLNQRLRESILAQNGWSVNSSPPRFLQEGSPPREMPVREPSPGWVSPVGSPKQYPSVVLQTVQSKPLLSSPPRYRQSSPKYSARYTSRSPPPGRRRRMSPVRYGPSPHTRETWDDSSPRRRYYGSPPRRPVSPGCRRYASSPSTGYSTSPPRHHDHSSSPRYTRSPSYPRYSRSRSPRSRSPPMRRKIYSPPPVSSSRRPSSPICSPSPPLRKLPPSPVRLGSPSVCSVIVDEEWDQTHRTNNKKSDKPKDRQCATEKKKKSSRKRRRSPEILMEWYKPPLIEHSPSRYVIPEHIRKTLDDEDSSDISSSLRDPRLRGRKPPLSRTTENPEKISTPTMSDKTGPADIDVPLNTWINGNGMPVLNSVQQQWPPPPGGMNSFPGGMNSHPGNMNSYPGNMNSHPGNMNSLPGGMNPPPGGMNPPPGGMNPPPGGMNPPPGGMNPPPGNMNQPPNYGQWMPNNPQPFLYPWPSMYANVYPPQNGVPWQQGPPHFAGFPPNQAFSYEQMDQ